MHHFTGALETDDPELAQALAWFRGCAMVRGERWAVRALVRARRLGRESELLARDVFDSDEMRAAAVHCVDDLGSSERVRDSLAVIAWERARMFWKELREMSEAQRASYR